LRKLQIDRFQKKGNKKAVDSSPPIDTQKSGKQMNEPWEAPRAEQARAEKAFNGNYEFYSSGKSLCVSNWWRSEIALGN
jgi:hypothetical protein